MKKVRVNKQYGEWFYEKETGYDLEQPIYHFHNKDKSECYTVWLYHQMFECIKQPTKEAREQYLITYC